MAGLPDEANTHDVLELVFEPGADVAAIWDAVYRKLVEDRLVEERYKFDHGTRPLAVGRITNALARSHRASFHVEGDDLQVYFLRQGQSEIDVLYIETRLNQLRGREDEWVLAFHDSIGGIISARVYDQAFNFWQSQRQINTFQVAGRSLANRSIIVDPDFKNEIVDVSCNPGRTIWRVGYKEALGHLMWVSGGFCSRVGLDPRLIETSLGAQQLRPSLWRLSLNARDFTEGGDAKALEAARELLFGPASVSRH